MKKNFFKKLSFVLALAMIVTALAPAAGVFAAAKPKLNSKDKTLFLSVDGKDEFDFNIANKKSGWSYKWTSANKKVATVNAKNGVTTAVGAGKTSVSVVIKDKKGEEVTTLKASVLVRDNIKELTITNLPEGDKLAVGASNDFNRSYKTVAGLTKGSQAITRWVVTDKDGKVATTATIDDKGVFTATEAGEYTITANAFQSKAKYNSWLADSEKYASYVTATATYKVTVAPSIVSAKQTTLKKFDLTFDTAVKADDVKKNLVVSYLAGTTKVTALVDAVEVDETGKIASVKMDSNFIEKSTYVAEYPEMGEAQFVAATSNLEDVTGIAITTKTVPINETKEVAVAIYNKDGVNLAGDNELDIRVNLEKTEGAATGYLDGKNLTMYTVGDTVTLKATYHTYQYKDGVEVGNFVATAVVTAVEQSKDSHGNLNAWTIGGTAAADAPSSFAKTTTQMFKNTQKQLYVLLKGKNASDEDLYTTNSANYDLHDNVDFGTLFTFVSSNTNVVSVDKNSGLIYGVGEGTATVVVYYDGVQVGACTISVIAGEKAAMVSLDSNKLVLSNAIDEEVTMGLNVKNQLGDDYDTANYTVLVTPNNNNTSSNNLLVNSVNGTFNANSVVNGKVVNGTYGYTVKVTDTANGNAVLSTGLSVVVQDPGTTPAISYYQVVTDKISYDMKSGDDISTAEVGLKAYGFTSSGVKAVPVALSSIAGLRILDGNGDPVAYTTTPSGSTIISLVTPTSISGGAITDVYAATEATGTWVIKDGKVGTITIRNTTFEVKNTQPVVSVTVKKRSTSKTLLTDVVDDCFTFTVGEKTLKAVTMKDLSENVTVSTGANVLTFKTLYLYEELKNGGYVRHKVDMKNITVVIGQ